MPNLFRVVFTDAARNDIDSIVNYLGWELRSLAAVESFDAALISAHENLSSFPTATRVYPTSATKISCRIMPVGSYRMFYVVDEPQGIVQVLRVLHSSQDADSIITD
ncbi:MAG: type II toxin-antitoxin system RelE/ParE family toxin [Actinomycetaceae bacterium]|nr:type II toxin-antitoxin system RelE/ParE family toxin [Actinomycetaceae bacterium]